MQSSLERQDDLPAAMDPSTQSSSAYFSYYSSLSAQQNMLQDSVRTLAYQHGIQNSASLFMGKTVLDVGCGSGILSFFALRAGAGHVYAVEASEKMSEVAKRISESNGFADGMTVIAGKIEDVTLPVDSVDAIISEPVGVLLLHERMWESVIWARMKYTRNGKKPVIIPSSGTIYLAPFTDYALHSETSSRARFWQNNDFCGIDLSVMHEDAIRAAFSHPIAGGFDPKSLFVDCQEEAIKYAIDFNTVTISELKNIEIVIDMQARYTGIMHGIAGWFDVAFPMVDEASDSILSTSPWHPRTHWHQIRFPFLRPIAVNKGDRVWGGFVMLANDQRSYDIHLKLGVNGREGVLEQEWRLQDHLYGNLGQAVVEATSKDQLGLYQ